MEFLFEYWSFNTKILEKFCALRTLGMKENSKFKGDGDIFREKKCQ